MCPTCGAANPAGQKFCGECGARLASGCPACGSPVPPGQKFCGECGAPVAVGPVSAAPGAVRRAPVAERRRVSVLFADLVGFTPFAEERDAETVRDTLSRYFELASDIVGRYGGTVEKFIGDAVMAVWGVPTAHEDDAERAVRAGLELLESVPRLGAGIAARAGVLTGEAAVTLGATNQGMVAGDLVNTASRLQAAAPAGAVLVGEATRDAAQGSIAFEALGSQTLKGKAVPVPAWRAVRVVAERGGSGRGDALEPPFVGRSDELRLLKEQFHAAGRDRRARMVSIVGQAGIGKSRLAWELEKYLDGVVELVRWHRGRSPAYGEGLTFWALGEMVRRRAGLVEGDSEATTRAAVTAMLAQHVPDADERRWMEPRLLALLGLAESPPGGREELFAAWRTFFERLAADGTVVMVFEDLHWADDGLLDFIEHLLDWSRNQPLFVVSLARPELLERRPGWGTDRRGAVAIRLGPLPEADMRELLAGLLPGLPEAAVARVLARADGFPLYAVETVRMLLADGRIEREGDAYRPVGDLDDLEVPGTLHALAAARLDALPADERSLLQVAAVLGQSFAPEALAAISGRDRAALEPQLASLRRRELLAVETDPRAPTRGQQAFVQALVREVAYGSLAKRDRRGWHLAAARYYEALGDDELAGVVATHYLEAHRAAPEGEEGLAAAAAAREALLAAADRAEALGSLSGAADTLQSSLEVTVGPEDRAATLQRMGWDLALATRFDEGELALAGAAAVWAELGDRGRALEAIARQVSSLLSRSQIGAARELVAAHLADAEALLGDPAAEVGLAWFSEAAGRAAFRAGDHQTAVLWSDRALPVAERQHLDELVAMSLITKAVAMTSAGRVREGIALQIGAYADARSHGLHGARLRSGVNLAAYFAASNPRASLDYTLEGIETARRLGLASFAYYHSSNLATPAIRLGDWDMGLARFDELAEGNYDAVTREAIEDGRCAILILRGQVTGDRASRRIAAARAADDPQELQNGYLQGLWEAFARGDLEAAVGLARLLHEMGPGFHQGSDTLDIARVALHAGDDALAGALADTVDLALGDASDGDMAAIRAGVAARRGDAAEALALYRTALSVYRDFGLRFDVALTGLDMAVLLPGDLPEVRAAVADARAILTELRATPFLARLDALAEVASAR
jgi:class 3 adenylate cyclase/predicted nucleic acid-binding Zn ribbon protein